VKAAKKAPIGRPALPVDEKMQVVSVRLTPAQAAKYLRLGGGAWLRDRIDKAREPG
jgi:hypothetical protein